MICAIALPASALLGSAALAIPPPLQHPDWCDCAVERRDPAGTVSVTQSIPPEGAGSPRVTVWHPRIGAEGKRIAFLHPSATAGVLVELSEY